MAYEERLGLPSLAKSPKQFARAKMPDFRYSAGARYRNSEAENVCAENNDANYFHEDEVPIPQTKIPDF